MTDHKSEAMRQSLSQANALANQAKALGNIDLAISQAREAMKAFQAPVLTSLGEQYKNLWGINSAAEQAMKIWREPLIKQSDQMRNLFDQAARTFRFVPQGNTFDRLTEALTASRAMQDQMRSMFGELAGTSSISKMLSDQANAMRISHSGIAESMSAVSAMQKYLKDFEHINKQWQAPVGLLDSIASLRALQDQIGKAALPTIDFAAAGALATVLGKEGMEDQLGLLGIEPDGTTRPIERIPEKGALSRKQPDPTALVSILLTILIFMYQEVMRLRDATDDAVFKAEMQAAMQVQIQQINHLVPLIEKTFAEAARKPEDRFVVRGRVAKVRFEPKHGTPTVGELLPNEVVYPIARRGKWVEVEFYHWLEEEWQTGWVLKKYLERVPVSYSESSD